ncbi:hypothetical protein OG21DRAFT_1484267 [Imleria badia]|nr:hypothetical protein OG21DRAFT_1484267 [Imleria badia]
MTLQPLKHIAGITFVITSLRVTSAPPSSLAPSSNATPSMTLYSQRSPRPPKRTFGIDTRPEARIYVLPRKATLRETICSLWYPQAPLCVVDFEHEPRFTCGWTLQELLTPRRIKFYDKGWRASRPSQQQGRPRTRVHLLQRHRDPPDDDVVATTVMASKAVVSGKSCPVHRTARIEDTAYCLYGLFDVHPTAVAKMPFRGWSRQSWRDPTRGFFAWSGQASERHSASSNATG